MRCKQTGHGLIRKREIHSHFHHTHSYRFYACLFTDFDMLIGSHLRPVSISGASPAKCSWKVKKYQFSSVAQSCPTLCNPINRSTPGLPVHHQLPEFIHTHVHRVSDAIQLSHPLSSPSPSAPNPSQHQSLFQ